jgi:hypothetical protein
VVSAAETSSSGRSECAAPADPPSLAAPGLTGSLPGWFVGVIVALLFWNGLLLGTYTIDGDPIRLIRPFKWWYAQRLRHGELALWNPLVAFGMPVLGESETAVFYPLNVLCYGGHSLPMGFAVHTVLHYVLAFGFAFQLARRLGARWHGALLSAGAYTYGWFPARVGQEWAITTGAWLPAILWAAESWLQTQRRRWLALTSALVGLQLFAGHFHVAWMTWMILIVYTAGRAIQTRGDRRPDAAAAEPGAAAALRRTACVALALGVGAAIAAIQLLPTWELKQLSVRRDGVQDQPMFPIPAWYLAQAVAPWHYYGNEQVLARLERDGGHPHEDHLYVGLITLPLALCGLWAAARQPGHELRPACMVLLGSLVLAVGWGMSAWSRVPGFSFFGGHGRYGLGAAWAVALAAGFGLDTLLRRMPVRWSRPLTLAALAVLLADCHYAFQRVTQPIQLAADPLARIQESRIAQHLSPMDRIIAPEANGLTIVGASQFPSYVPFAPAVYAQIATVFAVEQPDRLIQWMSRVGVTYFLSVRGGNPHPAMQVVYRGPDPALARLLREPAETTLTLLRLRGSRGRVFDVHDRPIRPTAFEETANTVGFDVETLTSARVVLAELAYPGWTVRVDGQAAPPLTIDGLFRAVDVPAGRHRIEWVYRPGSLIWGGGISVAAVLGLIGWLCAGRWGAKT